MRLVPLLGALAEKSMLCSCREVFGASPLERARSRFQATTLNTFDMFGSHAYQHHKRDDEIRALTNRLEPDPAKVLNFARCFSRPSPVRCALRVRR